MPLSSTPTVTGAPVRRSQASVASMSASGVPNAPSTCWPALLIAHCSPSSASFGKFAASS
jgi:hypothetical protein